MATLWGRPHQNFERKINMKSRLNANDIIERLLSDDEEISNEAKEEVETIINGLTEFIENIEKEREEK